MLPQLISAGLALTFQVRHTINSGDFYLVMIQGGNFPNCAPIAVDQTNPVMRSYSRFVTGGAPWTPAGFNDFMMRALFKDLVALNFSVMERRTC
jgi:hypothetical protein